ncbi:CpaE family protein [Sphingoaurantiacus capsulatus]|uniref:CpaE family protein n=1 Tax=Sphingoaurantiacus capsulatus TaxID=1771310 RepID=A0ABV7X7Q2_9SPHN
MNAPWNPNKRSGGLALREPFAAFVCDDATAEAIRPVVAEVGWPADKINKGGVRNAVQALSVSAGPQILFVDLGDSSDPLNDINALAEVCEPGTIVIAAGLVNDVRLYRDLIASGLQDYLLKPLDPAAVRESLLNAQGALAGPKAADVAGADKPRLTVAVIGARGGVGATSLATSLAWMLAERQQRSTALLDLDVHFGTGALAFDLEPGRGLTDALENPSRIDGLFIERAIVRATERLAVLSAEAPIAQPLMVDGSALFHLQEEMRGAFEGVVVDLPRTLAVQHPHLVGEVQQVIVVTEQSLAATRDTIRLLGWLKSQAPNARVTIVVNKLLTAPAPEVSRKDFETSIERRIDVVIPYDAKLAVSAARQGKCLAAVAKGSKLSAPFDQLSALATSDFEADAGHSGPKKSLIDKFNLKGLLSKGS